MITVMIEGQVIDLPAEFSFEYSEENMFMEEEILPIPFTTTLEFPIKESLHNQVVFGYSHRLGSIPIDKSYRCIIIFESFTIADGWFTIEEIGDTISGELKFIDPMLDFDKPLDTLPWPAIYVGVGSNNPLEISGSRPSSDNRGGDSVDGWEVMVGNINTYFTTIGNPIRRTYVCNESVKFSSLSSPRSNTYRGQAYTLERSMYFGGTFRHNNIDIGYIFTPYLTGTPMKPMFPILPAVDAQYAIKLMLGDKVKENPLLSLVNDEDMRLFLQTVCSPNYTEGLSNYPYFSSGEKVGEDRYKKYFDVALFMPSRPVSDLLKNILNLFCCSLYIDKGLIYIKKNTTILSTTEYIDISNFPVNYISKSILAGKKYRCGYKELETEYIAGDIASVNYLNDIVLDSRSGSEGMFVDRFGNVWERIKIKETLEGWQYRCIWSRMHSEKPLNSEPVFEKLTELTPIWESFYNRWDGPFTPDVDWPQSDGSKKYYQTIAMSLEKMGGKDDLPRIGYLNDYSTTMINGQLGIDDLLRNYHAEYKLWVEKDKSIVTLDILLPSHVVFNIKLWGKIYFQGKMFLLRKRSVNIYCDHIGITSLELVEC